MTEPEVYDAVGGKITIPFPKKRETIILYAGDDVLSGMWTDVLPNQVLITSIINLSSGRELCLAAGVDLVFFSGESAAAFDFGPGNIRMVLEPLSEPSEPSRTIMLSFRHYAVTRLQCQPGSLVQEQAAPLRNDHPAVWDLVMADMRERDAEGRRRYGTPLQPHNGRRPLVDAYQEALDLVVYLRQEIYEREGR